MLGKSRLRMPRLPILLAVCAVLAGCNRQDAERLGRVGTKVSAHAKAGSAEMGAKFDANWPKKEPTLHDKVHDRLRFDKALDGVKLDINVKDKEVELKGVVKDAAQKQRACKLAETVVGVEKVSDAITIREPDEAKKAAE